MSLESHEAIALIQQSKRTIESAMDRIFGYSPRDERPDTTWEQAMEAFKMVPIELQPSVISARMLELTDPYQAHYGLTQPTELEHIAYDWVNKQIQALSDEHTTRILGEIIRNAYADTTYFIPQIALDTWPEICQWIDTVTWEDSTVGGQLQKIFTPHPRKMATRTTAR